MHATILEMITLTLRWLNFFLIHENIMFIYTADILTDWFRDIDTQTNVVTVANYEFNYSKRNETIFPTNSTVINFGLYRHNFRSFKPRVARNVIESLHPKKTHRKISDTLFSLYEYKTCPVVSFVTVMLFSFHSEKTIIKSAFR